MARGTRRHRLIGLACVAASAALVLAGCGGGNIKSTDTSAAGGKECGDLNIAVNPWTGYVTNAHLIGYVAQTKLGCKVAYQDVKGEVGWQGMANGSIDTIVENWGHPDLKKKYIEQQKTVEDAGPTGGKGIIGWYVPPWMADKYPDITDWKNLNKYASLFKTSESGGKGQLLDGDPSYVTNDEALVKNLKLDFKVVTGGSEAALLKSATQAQEQKKALLFYFWTPHWLFDKVDLVRVNLPAYTQGCDSDAKKVACDYAELDLDKIVSKKFADTGGKAYDLVKNFSWTNEDQNAVADDMTNNGMSGEEAAKKWVEANKAKWQAWI